MRTTITFQYHEGKDSDGTYRAYIDMIEGASIIQLVEMEYHQHVLKEIAEMLNSGNQIILISPWYQMTDMHIANILNACLRIGYTEIIPIGTSERASYYLRKHETKTSSGSGNDYNWQAWR